MVTRRLVLLKLLLCVLECWMHSNYAGIVDFRKDFRELRLDEKQNNRFSRISQKQMRKRVDFHE